MARVGPTPDSRRLPRSKPSVGDKSSEHTSPTKSVTEDSESVPDKNGESVKIKTEVSGGDS